MEKHQETSHKVTKKESISHEETLTLLQQFSDKELYTKPFYSRTRTTSLEQYFQSSLASHYAWSLRDL
ncbi:ClbS/DfsB family four-helix bundle protein [Lactococcus ileimucosae]|uniref:ClbS/DfsB family four-helix bundle protein n=1 Tax=Lactococcus ileimucosae TaxID=2941329 RepID=UPI003514D6B5